MKLWKKGTFSIIQNEKGQFVLTKYDDIFGIFPSMEKAIEYYETYHNGKFIKNKDEWTIERSADAQILLKTCGKVVATLPNLPSAIAELTARRGLLC